MVPFNDACHTFHSITHIFLVQLFAYCRHKPKVKQMGEKKIALDVSEKSRIEFIRNLLDDVKALERMLDEGLVEKNISRIGAEQEFCLVNSNWRPSKDAGIIIDAVNDPHFTTELARYNIEINLDPFELKDDCFTLLETQLMELLEKARRCGDERDIKTILVGILPTISKVELEMDYMTPNPRYAALNDRMRELRGDDFELNIRGVDELNIVHDSVLFEACNTSFQMHLQIDPDDFIKSYNWSQAIAGPVLALSSNSPLLLGRELWSETRIALFQQSIDTRLSSYALVEQQARVTFGDKWAAGSIVDLFKNEIARYKIILDREIELNSLEQLDKGIIPKLPALSLHNGTIYRWNRPCYGVGNGRPHVRIENRYIPSGPTVIDEMANFAFWVGLMKGRPSQFDDIEAVMDFREAKDNFIKAARTGKASVMSWLGSLISVRDLVSKELLPMAYDGLLKSNIDQRDANRLLQIIEKRNAGHTGAQWTTTNYRNLRKTLTRDDALLALTKTMHENQVRETPVHDWGPVNPNLETHESASQVQHIMSTLLLTVRETDLAELATSIMEWKGVHHVPVEDEDGNLCGLLTWTHLQRFKAQGNDHSDKLVKDIMTKSIETTSPKTNISDAIRVMKEREFGCLPVVQGAHLVGIITIKDVTAFDHD